MATATERMVHLALSQRAAKILKGSLEEIVLEQDGDIDEILTNIIHDLIDQIEDKPKKKGVKKRGK